MTNEPPLWLGERWTVSGIYVGGSCAAGSGERLVRT